MKTKSADNGCRAPRSHQSGKGLAVGSHALAFLGSLLFALGPLPNARADLSAPDNVLYGLIVADTNLITASATAFVVEARRTNGLLVARYHIGDRPDVGNYYVLAIKVEELAPRHDPASVLVNEPLTIVVASNSVDQVQQPFTVTERGQVTRLDFGRLPTNLLSRFEAWAWVQGLDLDSQNLDADADGVSNLAEYLAGTDPNDAASKFLLRITGTKANAWISFDALRAEGTGYEGRTRHYALEWMADLHSIFWQAVPGYSDLVGANQVVVYDAPSTNTSFFFQGKVWLDAAP